MRKIGKMKKKGEKKFKKIQKRNQFGRKNEKTTTKKNMNSDETKKAESHSKDKMINLNEFLVTVDILQRPRVN